MKGISYVVDDVGRKTAVVVDLKKYSELWEDVYDALLAAEREGEPRESMAQVKRRLQRSGKLNRNA